MTLNTHYLTVRKQKSLEFLCDKWLSIREGLVYGKIMNCTAKEFSRKLGRAMRKWEIKLGKYSKTSHNPTGLHSLLRG
jgi:hypothetical protein